MPLLISEKLVTWYLQAHRNLPWRKTKDPYKIWISEVILQQTRVEQGLPYYHSFIKKYPNVKSLATAPLQKVLKQWQGLGYYSRARNLHQAAKQIVEENKGKFPTEFDDLLKLKGIGQYTAAAIASFAFDKPQAVVDGNVMRVLSRLFAVSLPVNSTAGINFFRKKADAVLDMTKPSLHNQAMMELGALICKPVNPLCVECVLNKDCKAFQTGKVSHFPVKEKKSPPEVISLHFLIITKSDELMIYQRNGKGIWKGLFEFPSLEKKGKVKWKAAEARSKLLEIGISKFSIKTNHDEINHLLSHRTIWASFSFVNASQVNLKKAESAGYKLIRKKDLKKYPIHRLMEKIVSLAGIEIN